MGRLGFMLAATLVVAALAPASAIAHHHSHGRHSRSHAHHARIKRFGDLSSQPTPTSSASNAGTVQSVQNGVLTIQLRDGSTVAGTVTGDTAIECTASGPSQSTGDEGTYAQSSDSQDDQNSRSQDQTGQTPGSQDQGDQGTSGQNQGDDDGANGEDDGTDQGQSTSCSTASLTNGAPVLGAELRISGAGNTWERIDLAS